jgi:hypothetical protein
MGSEMGSDDIGIYLFQFIVRNKYIPMSSEPISEPMAKPWNMVFALG